MKYIYTMIDPAYGSWELLYQAEDGQCLLKNCTSGVIRSCHIKNYKFIKLELINERPETSTDCLSIL